MDNFKCFKCDYVTFINSYKIKILENGGTIYLDKFKKELYCPKCKNKLVSILKKKDNFMVNIGKFKMMSREEKTNSLKKRSHEHFKNVISKNKHL